MFANHDRVVHTGTGEYGDVGHVTNHPTGAIVFVLFDHDDRIFPIPAHLLEVVAAHVIDADDDSHYVINADGVTDLNIEELAEIWPPKEWD